VVVEVQMISREWQEAGDRSQPLLKDRARICKRLWRPGIDSEDSLPLAYVAWRADTTNRVVVPARQAGNRFLGFLTGLQIRAQYREARRI
jgi:hypothetical protein